MKHLIAAFVAALCLFSSACHRPVGYFQRTPHTAARLSATVPTDTLSAETADTLFAENDYKVADSQEVELIASVVNRPATTAKPSLERRMHRAQTMLNTPVQPTERPAGPGPKPRKQLRLGNRIRQGLGLPLREELNWWQRISWKLKASFFIILLAVVFAIAQITVLAIIFGLLGAFLLITGLKRSFKTRRPWL